MLFALALGAAIFYAGYLVGRRRARRHVEALRLAEHAMAPLCDLDQDGTLGPCQSEVLQRKLDELRVAHIAAAETLAEAEGLR